jgi:hypothetical protein
MIQRFLKDFPRITGRLLRCAQGERSMQKTCIHIEIVPVEVAKRVLEEQNAKAKRNGSKRVPKKSGKQRNGANAFPRKGMVLIT